MAVLLVILGVTLAWAGLVWFFWRAGAWLPYYVIGAAGCAVLIVIAGRELVPLESWVRQGTANGVHLLAPAVGVHTTLRAVDPGELLVVGVPHHTEWTLLSVGLESSGLLECAALVGLVAFFPAQPIRQRAITLLIALALTFAANIVRVLFIVAAVAYGGQDMLDVAHVVLGRIVFFVFAIGIYWYAVTRPALRTVGKRLSGSPA